MNEPDKFHGRLQWLLEEMSMQRQLLLLDLKATSSNDKHQDKWQMYLMPFLWRILKRRSIWIPILGVMLRRRQRAAARRSPAK